MPGPFFIPFILVATFTMLNLFIAIIVNAMQNYSEAE
jgi:voltage-gated sodium channel